MTRHFASLVAGYEGKEHARQEVHSPYDDQVVGTVDIGGADEIESALATAWDTFRDRGSWLTVAERIAILERAATRMEDCFDELVEIAASEGGKPFVDSRVEVERAIEGVKLCAEHIRADHGSVIPMNEAAPNTTRMAFTQKEPVGVVVAVSAFNHPLNLIVHQVGAAIAAGCPTVVKPAEVTPMSCFRFVQILHDSGLPSNWCQAVVPESRELATRLVTDARVGFFSFIGSAAVGWMLKSKLAPGARCALEHGGAAPVIVHESADLDRLIPAILKGGYYHAGQVCVSVQRVYAPKSMINDLADSLQPRVTALRVGDPLDPATEVGPLIRPAEVTRVHEWVTEAVEGGAKLICGGERYDGNCYSPTLLLNPPEDCRISRQEVFGPVVCLYEYDDLDDAIARANGLDVAFQAAVFSQDIDAAMYLYHKLDATAVMVNDHTAFRQDVMPFAGLRHSGLGVGGIGYTIEDMQIDKMMVIKSVAPD
jgi:acyl-CoA reductase-like NAD-dependent aldehyde dehydrogenase